MGYNIDKFRIDDTVMYWYDGDNPAYGTLEDIQVKTYAPYGEEVEYLSVVISGVEIEDDPVEGYTLHMKKVKLEVTEIE